MNQQICLALDLKEDERLITEYEKYHKDVWPEVLASIRRSGIEDMQIFRTGNRLFMIMIINESFDAKKKAKADSEDKKVQEWEQLMDTFQKRLPWAKNDEKWVAMEKIFQL